MAGEMEEEREREPPLLDILVNVSACLAGPRPSGWVTQPLLWMAISSFIVYTPAAAKPLQTYSGNTSTLMLAGSTVCDYESADHPGEKLHSVQKDPSLPASETCQPAELLQSLCEPGAEPHEPPPPPGHSLTTCIQRKAEPRRKGRMQLKMPPIA